MLPDFRNIDYLSNGTWLQQKAYHALIDKKILYHLSEFDPVLTGTMPLDLFIEGKSDLDIICYCDHFHSVEKVLLSKFSRESDFSISHSVHRSIPTLLCRFQIHNFPVEIFCQNIPIEEQWAFRHMIAEFKLLQKFGDNFKQAVLDLKMKGIKTEPAFAQLLDLPGDPFLTLLLFERE